MGTTGRCCCLLAGLCWGCADPATSPRHCCTATHLFVCEFADALSLARVAECASLHYSVWGTLVLPAAPATSTASEASSAAPTTSKAPSSSSITASEAAAPTRWPHVCLLCCCCCSLESCEAHPTAALLPNEVYYCYKSLLQGLRTLLKPRDNVRKQHAAAQVFASGMGC